MNRRTFTLLEVLIAATVLALLMTVVLGLLLRTSGHVNEGLVRGHTDARSRSLQRVLDSELKNATVESITLSTPSPVGGGFTAVRYRRVRGFDADTGEIDTGPLSEIRFVLDSSERWSRTPVDDDGDGLVDEGTLVLLRDQDGDDVLDPQEQVTVLARDVDGSMLSFELPSGGQTANDQDAEIVVVCAIQKRLPEGQVTRSNSRLRISLRNE